MIRVVIVSVSLLLPLSAPAQVGGYAAELKCLGYQTDGDSNTSCQTSEPLNFAASFWPDSDDDTWNSSIRDPPDSETGNCSVNGGAPGCQRELGSGDASSGIWVPSNDFCKDGWADPQMHISQVTGASAGLPSVNTVMRVLEPSRFGNIRENFAGSPNAQGLDIRDQTICMRYYFSFEEGFDMDNWSGTDISMKWLEVLIGADTVQKGAFPKTSDRRFCEIADTYLGGKSGALRPNGGESGWEFPPRRNFPGGDPADGDGTCDLHEVGHIDLPPSDNVGGVLFHENCTQGANDPDGGTGWCRMEWCVDHNLNTTDTSITGSEIDNLDSVRVRYRVTDIDTGERSLYATHGSETTGTFAKTGSETIWNNFFQKEPRSGSSTEAPFPHDKATCCPQVGACSIGAEACFSDATCSGAETCDTSTDPPARPDTCPETGQSTAGGGYQHLPADRFFSHLMVAYKSVDDGGQDRGVGDWWIGSALEITEDIDTTTGTLTGGSLTGGSLQ